MQKPIFIGLVIIFAILFMPTPQRPYACGGGSVFWGWQKPPANADHIEELIRKNQTSQYIRSNRYWSYEDNGQVTLCETINGTKAYWRISSDRPDAVIVEAGSFGSSFR